MKKSENLAILGLLIAAVALGWQFLFAPAPKEPPRPEPVHVAVTPPPEETPEGEEKQVASANLPLPTEHDAHPFPPHSPEIAIVIDDMGLNLSGSQRAIKLPRFITLSFMPYAERLGEQTAEARANGHELLLHMPMEPMGRQDPGPGALLTTLTPTDVHARFVHALDSFEGFDGVNNHMGSRFTAYKAGMEIVIGELEKRHLFFLDSRTSAQTVGESTAQEHGLPTIARDVFLDDSVQPDAIRAQLAAAEKVARRKGYAVAIGHPHENTLAALEAWLPEAQREGFVLVPVHDLIRARAIAAKGP